MLTSTQVVETSVNVITNSPSQDNTHPRRPYLNDISLLGLNYLQWNSFVFKTHDRYLTRSKISNATFWYSFSNGLSSD